MLLPLIAFSMVGWVLVANPEGVRNHNNTFAFGESCVLNTTAHVVPVGTVREQTLYHLLVVSPRPAGTLCPAGTLFLLSAETFDAWKTKETREAVDLDTLRREVQKALEQR